MDGRPTWTDCDEAGDYVVPNVLSPRDLIFRPDNMDETVPHTRMIQLEHVPGKFKIGTIIPIHKPGKCRESTESYRPITLVSTLYKLFESILNSRLQAWLLLHVKYFPSPQQNAYQKHMG